MVHNRIPPLAPARKRPEPADEDIPPTVSGNWILRPGHRPLYVESADPSGALGEDEDEDEQAS